MHQVHAYILLLLFVAQIRFGETDEDEVDAVKLKRYKIFDAELQTINRDSITPPRSGDECKREFTIFFRRFKEKLLETEPFLANYKLDTYRGSSYERLSVGKSHCEYDVDVHIKLDRSVVKEGGVERAPGHPGYVTIELDVDKNHARNCPERVRIYDKWTNGKDKLLNPERFRRWGESVVAKTLNDCEYQLQVDDRSFELDRMTKSGPAFTLHVVSEPSGVSFDVDVVFTLSFDSWTLGGPGEWEGQPWIAVAKGPPNSDDCRRHCWRYSFPGVEKKLLSGYNQVKNVIRLIKRVRDECNMSYLASYHINTLFMWEIKGRKSKDYWNKSLGYVFVTMLYRLHEALEKGRIDFYFAKGSNLLDGCTKNQLQDGRTKIAGVLKKIEKMCDKKTPEKIATIFEDQKSIDKVYSVLLL